MKVCALVANGRIAHYDVIQQSLQRFDMIIAVDGGLNHCHEMGVTPQLIVGDFDSVNHAIFQEYSSIPCEKHPVDKEHTDLELALTAADPDKWDKIHIFAALGKRVDHTLANLHLIRSWPEKVILETEKERVFAISGTVEIETFPGQRISFLPFDRVQGVSSTGLKWDVKDATFDRKFMSVSNIALGNTVKMVIEDGDLICCLSK